LIKDISMVTTINQNQKVISERQVQESIKKKKLSTHTHKNCNLHNGQSNCQRLIIITNKKKAKGAVTIILAGILITHCRSSQKESRHKQNKKKNEKSMLLL